MQAVSSLAGSDVYKSLDSNVARAKNYLNSFSSCPPPVVLNMFAMACNFLTYFAFRNGPTLLLAMCPHFFYVFALGQLILVTQAASRPKK